MPGKGRTLQPSRNYPLPSKRVLWYPKISRQYPGPGGYQRKTPAIQFRPAEPSVCSQSSVTHSSYRASSKLPCDRQVLVCPMFVFTLALFSNIYTKAQIQKAFRERQIENNEIFKITQNSLSKVNMPYNCALKLLSLRYIGDSRDWLFLLPTDICSGSLIPWAFSPTAPFFHPSSISIIHSNFLQFSVPHGLCYFTVSYFYNSSPFPLQHPF